MTEDEHARARTLSRAAQVGDEGITMASYGSTGRIGTPAGCLRWMHEQARDRYVATGSAQALADLLEFTELLAAVPAPA